MPHRAVRAPPEAPSGGDENNEEEHKDSEAPGYTPYRFSKYFSFDEPAAHRSSKYRGPESALALGPRPGRGEAGGAGFRALDVAAAAETTIEAEGDAARGELSEGSGSSDDPFDSDPSEGGLERGREGSGGFDEPEEDPRLAVIE